MKEDEYWLRTCEALVTNMKGAILEGSSMYQVGGQPWHAPEEHLFTIKSLWAMLELEGLGLMIASVDIISFFDRENISDMMQTLHDMLLLLLLLRRD